MKYVVASRLKSQQGIFEGEYLREWAETVIQEQVSRLTNGEHDGKYLTFQELHDLTIAYPEAGFRDLKVVGSNFSSKQKEVYCHEDYPTAIISDAIRISMSIPTLFKPHKIYYKIDGERCAAVAPDTKVDGGLYDNYPIDCFDEARYLEPGEQLSVAADGKWYNPQTLGFRLVPEEVKRHFEAFRSGEHLELPAESSSGVTGIIGGASSAGFALQEERYNRKENVDRTVYINHLGISLVAFNLPDERKMALIQSGRDGVESYLHQQSLSIQPDSDNVQQLLMSPISSM